jgi:hypothetical protein
VQESGRTPLGQAQAETIATLAERHRFFHWQLEFPQVFQPSPNTPAADGGTPSSLAKHIQKDATPGERNEGDGGRKVRENSGFDVVLGNPPWEMMDLMEKEFFAQDAPGIAESAGSQRKKKIDALRIKNPSLWKKYQDALQETEAERDYIHYSGRFPLTTRGRLNSYSLFAETARNLLCVGGRFGLIMETGIATHDSNKEFFQSLIEQKNLVALYDFDNRKKLFPDVQGNMKFCLITVANDKVSNFHVAAQLQEVDDLRDNGQIFALTPEELALLNPNTLTLPTFRRKKDAVLVIKIYRKSQVLINEKTQMNPWMVSFKQGLFNMTSDSDIFKKQTFFNNRNMFGNVVIRSESIWRPLFEAKLANMFTHRHATFEGISFEDRLKTHAGTASPRLSDLQNPEWVVLPRYWVRNKHVSESLPNFWEHDWFIGFRNAISAVADARSVNFSIVPYSGIGNSMPIIFSTTETKKVCALYSSFNSFVFDYVTRQKASGGNLNFYIVKQLPVLPPFSYTTALLSFIVPRVLELTYTAWDLKAFADDVWKDGGRETDDGKLREAIEQQWQANAAETGGGHAGAEPPEWIQYLVPEEPEEPKEPFPHPPFMWDEERRFRLRAELDALYAHLYGLHRDELAYILDTFPIVKRKDEEQYGEFRTKRAILAYFDELADSDFDFPDKGPNVLAEDYVPLEEPEEPKEVEEPKVAEGKAAYQVEPADRRGSPDPGGSSTEGLQSASTIDDSRAAEDVQLTPAHGFEFYLAVQEELGGDVSIADIYAATLANPEVKTVEGLVRVMEDMD